MDTTLTPHVRRPAVSGYYYPEDPQVLRQVLGQLLHLPAPPVGGAQAGTPDQPLGVQGVIVPHGGLRQSGVVAGATLGKIQIPRRCVIIGPSHTGRAVRWSLFARGGYRTPLGIVEVDEALCDTLLESCPFLEADPRGHRGEHAIEVILPFLQYARPGELSIVPIVTGSDRAEEFAELAQALERAIRAQEESVLLIASSDLSHYETAASGAEKDQRLIEAMLNVDGPALLRAVQEGRAMMCGYGPVACVLMAAARLGAARGELISYGTSLEAGGDPHSVVGYAGIVVH